MGHEELRLFRVRLFSCFCSDQECISETDLQPLPLTPVLFTPQKASGSPSAFLLDYTNTERCYLGALLMHPRHKQATKFSSSRTEDPALCAVLR